MMQQEEPDENVDNNEESLYDEQYIGDLFDERENHEFAMTEVTSSTPLPGLRNSAQKNALNALKMMQTMGWDKGTGLGVNNQGRTSHIEVAQMSGRAGLGSKPAATTAAATTEDDPFGKQSVASGNRKLPGNFKIQKHEADTKNYPHQQKAVFISCRTPIVDTASLYRMYSKEELDDTYSRFCNRQYLQKVMDMKSEFDNVDEKIFTSARSRANPYELIGKSCFQNRAAVKMANIDKMAAVTSVELLPEENGVLYFADICAGPGGFTEYMYWRYKTERAKGWGFTLRGKNDFKLKAFNKDAPHDNFETCYGVDDTGDITHNENMKYLSDVIDKGTNGRGVAVLLGDGGFSVQGNYNNQEFLMKQIVLCQFLTSLLVLRKGGVFVCKAFDVYTNFSASLLYMLYQNFEHFSIVKPFTSRPANSERYIICRGLRARKPAIINFLFDVNSRLAQKQDVDAIIDPQLIARDTQFSSYFTKSNEDIMQEQYFGLQSIKKCIEDEYMTIKPKQIELQKRCLIEWNLPEKQVRSTAPATRGGRGGAAYRQQSYRQPPPQQTYYPPQQHASAWDEPSYEPGESTNKPAAYNHSSHHSYDDAYNPPYQHHYSANYSNNSNNNNNNNTDNRGDYNHTNYYPPNYYGNNDPGFTPHYQNASSSGGWEDDESTGGGWEDERPAKRAKRQ